MYALLCLNPSNPVVCSLPGSSVHEISQARTVEWVAISPTGERTSLIAQLVKNPPAMQKTPVRSLGWEDLLEKGKGTHLSILAWRIPWTV